MLHTLNPDSNNGYRITLVFDFIFLLCLNRHIKRITYIESSFSHLELTLLPWAKIAMESRISWYSHPGTKSWYVLSSALKATLGKDTILLSYVRSPWKLLTLPLWPEPYTLSQIADIQVSLLKKKKERKKINKQKPQFNRAGRSEQGALVPFENSRA